MNKFRIIFLALFLAALNVSGKILLPSVIADNMVLQQNSKVALWGKAKVNSRILITTSWNKKEYATGSDEKNGSWKLLVETPSAGGPFQITISDGEKLTLTNILIGEVWVCSGQSNMEMPVKGFINQPTLNSNEILMDADNPQIRLIRYERDLTRTPQYDCKSTSWQVSNAQSVKDFSAVGYQFAQILQRKLKVPVGIIMSTWGGTKIEAWMTENSLKSFPEIKIPAVSDTAKIIKNDPAVLFNAMINPIIGYGIKGVVWYQGEQNRSNHHIYDKLMVSMVKEWRTLWNRDEFPFYYVQIAPYKYKDVIGPADLLREAQLKASKQIPNSGMVVSMDVGAENFIHPPDKTTISKRLANWALANNYGMKGLAYASPVYKSMKIDKDVATIFFENVENGLSSFGNTLSAFEVAGEDKVFYPAKARITATGVTVQSDQVKSPVAVRYAFKDWIVGDLFNTEGLPASPFRTDNW
ncbi:sialate O-acetylesterase [Flavihumibacter sp. R14]|nr:sialate O-acetylesterase [Flavihumibacter soli]